MGDDMNCNFPLTWYVILNLSSYSFPYSGFVLEATSVSLTTYRQYNKT